MWEMNTSKKVKFVKVYQDAQVPTKQTAGAAGYDLYAYTKNECSQTVIDAGCTAIFDTGIRVSIPDGYYLAIVPRSGLAFKHGITVLNSPGTIDSDFTGNLKICLINHSKNKYTIKHGDRIAQAILLPYKDIEFEEVESLDKTERDNNGFGSTGR